MIHECMDCHKKFECSEFCHHQKCSVVCLCDDCDMTRGGGEWRDECKVKFLGEMERVIFT